MSSKDQNVVKKVTLKDQVFLTQEEYSEIRRIWEESKEEYNNIEEYISYHDLRKSVFIPDWWERNGKVCSSLASIFDQFPKKENFEQFRFMTRVFTGFSLSDMEESKGKSVLPLIISHEDVMKYTYNLEKSKYQFNNIWLFDEGLPSKYITPFPERMGEIGLKKNGLVINRDTVSTYHVLYYLHKSGILGWVEDKMSRNETVRILEIGGGYGALAYLIKNIFRNSDYYLCDIPQSLFFAKVYLTMNTSDKFLYIPNYKINEIKKDFDLVINTISLSEMTVPKLNFYCKFIDSSIGEHGIFFEVNNAEKGNINSPGKEYFAECFKYKKHLGFAIHKGEADVWFNGEQFNNILNGR